MADHSALQPGELAHARGALLDALAVRTLTLTADVWLNAACALEHESDGDGWARNALVRAERCEYMARLIRRTLALSVATIRATHAAACRSCCAAVASEDGPEAPPTHRV